MTTDNPESRLAPRAVANVRGGRVPARRILDPAFRYTPSHLTDLRETFARVRRELQQERSLATESGNPAPAV